MRTLHDYLKNKKYVLWRYVIVSVLLFASYAESTAQTMMPLPNFGSTYSGSVRGYWFTAPTSFIITGVKVPADAGSGTQNIHIMKINDATPVAWSTTSTNFSTLAYIQGAPNNVVQSVSIQVNAGDHIGILGQAGTSNSYSVSGGPFPSTILGQPVTLERLLHQGNITSGPAPDYSWEVGSSPISRVEMYYTASTPCSGAPVVGTTTGPSSVCLNQSVSLVGSGPAVGGISYQWQESSNGTTWTDIVGATNSSYNMPGGITADTYYRLAVTCSNSSMTTYSNDVFVQLTAAQPTPWLYDVETAQSTTNSQIDDCWSSSPNNTTSAYRWDVGSSTPSSATGANSAYSGSNFFYTEASSGTNGAIAHLTTPLIDLSNLTVPQLGFFYHMYGSDINVLNVQVSDDNGLTWTTEHTITGQQQTSGGDAWLEETILLNNYTGVISVRFEAIRGASFDGDISLDDISIREAPTCIKPTNLTATNITSTSADLSWTENNGATTWNIEYGVAGFAQGTGTPANQITANPYNITISPNTAYEFYVQTDCGGGDLSGWAGPFSFSNVYCLPIYTSTSEYLSLIETVGAIVDVSHTATSFPLPNGFTDETAQTMQVYETMVFDLNTVYNPTYGHVVRVWVDWNNDFTFDHATELVSTITGNGGLLTQQITVPAGTPVGTYRVRVRGVYGTGANPLPCSSETWGSAIDFMMEVITPPTCLPVMDIDTVNVSATSIELDWTELNGATAWSIEYGLSGFTPGNGTYISVPTNPFNITGLNPSASYDFYVRSICSSTDSSAQRGPFSQYTDCGIAIAPFYEGFNNGVQPQCWENLSSNSSTSANNYWKFDNGPDYGAANHGRTDGTYAWSDGSSTTPDSMMLVSPEIDISQLTTPYLSFEWYSNNTNNPGDNVPLIIEVFDGSSWNLLDTLMGDSTEWLFVNYDLSAFSNNTIKVRFMTNQVFPNTLAQYNDILLDEVRIDDCISLGGQDGTLDVCRLDSTVNLEGNIIVKPNGGGNWSFPDQPSYLVDDTIFNVQFLPAGTYDVLYVERAVCYDTTFATINVFGPSSAGTDGSITVCMNEPINLYGVIGGNVDLGGEWFDFTNTLLPNSQPKAQPIPGNYNYFYVADNGVCPADTSIVTVTVDGTCDYLSLGEELFAEISVYPNPTTSILNIVNPSNTSSLKLEMLDMNGRVVLVENTVLDNASEATLAIDHLEKGIYTLRVYNSEGQKTFKVVKQ